MDRVYILCVLLKEPINWNPTDEYQVHTVFLILTPQSKPNLHIKALQSIGMFCRKPDYRSALMEIIDRKRGDHSLAEPNPEPVPQV
jgi:mannitol/fructose-specific phosphotransferase system IIA component (Ntr-type)